MAVPPRLVRNQPDMKADGGVPLMVEPGAVSFVDALHGRVADILDSCTQCGKCVAACPMVEPAGIDLGADAVNAPAVVGGVLDLLAGGEGTPEAERWAQVCTNSGTCIPACDYGVNPRFIGEHGADRLGGQNLVMPKFSTPCIQYFTTIGRDTRIISRLQLAPSV